MVVNMLFGMKRAIDPDVRLLQAAADPTRLAILRELSGADTVCACDFTSCCEVGQPTVSHHLRVLREAGWVSAARRGSWVYYSLNGDAVDRFRALAGELVALGDPSATAPVAGLSTRRQRLPVIQPADLA
jgi:ArsR family transcriptional regulator